MKPRPRRCAETNAASTQDTCKCAMQFATALAVAQLAAHRSGKMITNSTRSCRRFCARREIAERGFDPRTSGLWAQHASTAPLCCVLERLQLLCAMRRFRNRCNLFSTSSKNSRHALRLLLIADTRFPEQGTALKRNKRKLDVNYRCASLPQFRPAGRNIGTSF